jgi:hypothetical protein
MVKYKVKAVALSKKTGFQVGKIRNETIDTTSNSLFKNANSCQDVKRIYESFWALDKGNPEKVKVLDVKRAM